MENFIKIYKKVLPTNICEYMIKTAEENMDLSNEGKTMSGVNTNVKKSTDINFLQIINKHPEVAKIIPHLKKAIDSSLVDYFTKYDILGNMKTQENKTNFLNSGGTIDEYNSRFLEEIYYHNVIFPGSIHVKKYFPNDGFYNWHCDQGRSSWLTYSRSLVAMFYLNDVEEGGQTEFESQEVSIKPSQGDLIIWPAGWTHKHRGKSPISNAKYICNFWLLSRNPGVEEALHNMETIEINGEDYKNNWLTERLDTYGGLEL